MLHLSILGVALLGLLILTTCSCGWGFYHDWEQESWTDTRGVTHTILIPPGDGAKDLLDDCVARTKRKYPERSP